MTYEEAIEAMENFKDEYGTSFEQGEPEAFAIIVEALEKQIPKPKHKYRGYRCVCGEEVAKHQDYCEYCGQRLLDWSEEE